MPPSLVYQSTCGYTYFFHRLAVQHSLARVNKVGNMKAIGFICPFNVGRSMGLLCSLLPLAGRYHEWALASRVECWRIKVRLSSMWTLLYIMANKEEEEEEGRFEKVEADEINKTSRGVVADLRKV